METSFMNLPNGLAKLLAIGFCCAVFFQTGCTKNETSKTTHITITEPVWATKAEVFAQLNGDANEPLVNTGKIFLKDRLIFLNELNKGIHVIDNNDPAHPKQVAFIKIPGNVDISIKDDILYADMYSDLLAIDISDIHQVKLASSVMNVFTNVYQSDSNRVAVDWITKDTVVTNGYYGCANCQFYSTPSPSSAGGKGNVSTSGKAGSMAKMVLMNNYLFAINNWTSIAVLSVSNAAEPLLKNNFNTGFSLETIYPFQNKLFIGSTVGMFMYDVSDPENPLPLGQFGHVRSCDPVVADGDYAYVTLHSESFCGGDINELDVVDVSHVMYPSLVQTLQLKQPKGLSKDGDLLFVCDAREVVMYDASIPKQLKALRTIEVKDPYDIITDNNIALVVAKDGIYQFDYSTPSNVKRLSKIATTSHQAGSGKYIK